jgi:hypothetical protein
MKKITPAHLEFLADKAPDLVKTVRDAKQSGDSAGVTLSLAMFNGDLGLLYAFLWLADSENVTVRFVPAAR